MALGARRSIGLVSRVDSLEPQRDVSPPVVSAASDHLDQARKNRELAERLLAPPTDPTNVQWAVIAAFYFAVHCMQAHLITLGHDPTNHAQRGALIGRRTN
jgi:hypothetical protein